IIGSNGVLNRVSEDGVLTDWFRAPHKRYGTTFHMINMIVILQLLTIIGSRGNVYVLGEAYAFGVIWSFAFKALAVLVLRFKDKSPREWKVPLNIRLDGNEIPLGLGIIAALLFSVAGINLITKQVATISGVAFTLIFFILFTVSERLNERKRGHAQHVEMDQFRLQMQDAVTNETVQVRPGCTLCLVRDYNTLDHVRKALELTHTGKRDLVVMTVQVMKGPDTGYENIGEQHLFTNYEQLLFSKVIALAEKAGKHVDLLVVPSSNVFEAIAHTAAQLDCSEIIAGRSSVMSPEEQAKRLGDAWEALPNKPKHQVCFRIVESDGKTDDFYLGAHVPHLADDDINIIHKLWLDVTRERGGEDAHHKEIVRVALERLEEDLEGDKRCGVLKQLRTVMRRRSQAERAKDEEDSETQKVAGSP
ncbi:MAG TPA: APC family permease, partial [Blastocatellia bacterium]|nr:APC family permease [Blastocatellia bacterium]